MHEYSWSFQYMHEYRYITVDILRQIYHGRCITAHILWHIYILQQIYYGRHNTAVIVRQICCGGYILRQLYYGRYITSDILRQMRWNIYIYIYCVPQKRPCLNKFSAPEALACCIRICLLQHIAPRTPLDRAALSHCGPAPLGHCGPGPCGPGPHGPGPCGPMGPSGAP